MKDVIEEQRKVLLEFVKCDDFRKVSAVDMCNKINEAFLKIANEADFVINRLNGEAGIIERASTKLPNLAEFLKRTAQIMRGYAARIENSQTPDFDRRIVVPRGFTVVPRGNSNGS